MKILLLFPSAAAITAAFSLFSSAAIAQTTLSYTSPIAGYQSFVDEKVTAWKASNDNVGQIGGWRAYAKEAQQPDNTPTPSQSAVPMQQPAGSRSDVTKPDPHAGHKP